MTARKTEIATTDAKAEGVFENGFYTEQDVELLNGVKMPVTVIVDRDKLPATFSNLLSEGNGPALIVAQLSTATRRFLDLAGATMKDLETAIAPVIQRANELNDK